MFVFGRTELWACTHDSNDHSSSNDNNSSSKNDYKAFVKSAKVKNQTRYRVYVGPKIDKRRAVQDKAKIDAAFNTDSIVLKYAL